MSPYWGASELRPRVGFSPTRPQHEAGMRIDPPPSLACAAGTMPDATAAADPPEDPPVECSVFHGIARRAEAPRLGRREDAELGRVGLAADDEAGVDVALRQLLGHRRGVVAREVGPLVERRAGELRAEVLQEERHAAERPVGQLARRLVPGAVEELVDDRVQLRVELLDARDRLADQLGRRDLLGADQLRLCRRVQPCRVLAHAAHGSEARAAARLAAVQAQAGTASDSAGRCAPVRMATASVTETSAPQAMQRRRSSSSPPQPRCWRIIGRSPSRA